MCNSMHFYAIKPYSLLPQKNKVPENEYSVNMSEKEDIKNRTSFDN